MAASSYGTATINITGSSTQTASVNGSRVENTAQSKAYANQNIASNKGSITVSGNSTQTSIVDNAVVTNKAQSAGDVAVQNLASNVGTVSIDKSIHFTGTSNQTANVVGATLKNEANSSSNSCSGPDCRDGALAYQNAASNMGEVSISGISTQVVGISGSGTTVSNTAKGANTVAVQNMSSNYGKVNISGNSSQTTSIYGASIVANLANGAFAHAYQNIASNDSCDPPPVVCVGPACGPYAMR
ncbi:hypothetical protein [Comamonas sp. 26]|nr:hypothetical protein [Comamonas sp. 26]